MSDEDGPESPSAPEPPSPQEPREQQEPHEPAEPASEERAESRRPRLLPVWLLLGAAVIAGGAWAVTDRMGGESSSSDDTSVPLITASAEPWKVRPDDPGGMEIPNQGTLIYETLTTADPEEAPERVLPPPEEPLSPPLPEADRAEELTVAASGAVNEVTTLRPDSGVVEEPAPPLIEEATPVEPEPSEIAVIQEELLTEPERPAEPEAPTDFIAVEEEAPLEPEPLEIDGILLPPPKPGTLAAARIEESTLQDLGESAMTEAPPSDAVPEITGDELPELEPETLALIEDLLEREPEAPSEPVLSEDADPVPLPPYKPTRIARAAPAERETTAAPRATAPEPERSDSRIWRYVQLGAANSRVPLEGHWEMLRRRHQDVLIGLSPLIMPVDSGTSGITYRLRAGPLSDQAAAQRVCAQLKARGLDCFVPRD